MRRFPAGEKEQKHLKPVKELAAMKMRSLAAGKNGKQKSARPFRSRLA
jgi:hypothetical protein